MAGRGYGAALIAALGAMALAAPAAAQGPAGMVQSQAEKAAVLATVQKTFDAFAVPDIEAFKAVLAPGVVFYSPMRGPDGKMAMKGMDGREWLDRLPKTPPGIVERIWDPVVLQRGDIAVVWAPFDAKRGGKLGNCGVDSIDLVKLDGVWKITGLMWTSEINACKELGSPG